MVRWLPLESNPDVMNEFIKNLGVNTSKWKFADVFGLDDDLLMIVPQPVAALLLLFPISENYEKARVEQEERIKTDGQTVSPDVYFTKQTVGNACGTVAILHSIANNRQSISLQEGSFLQKFFESTKDQSAEERAVSLEKDMAIAELHSQAGNQGDTTAPSVDVKVNLHFISLVCVDSCLYELDGRRPFPINHGQSSPATFLKDGAKVCEKFISAAEGNVNFNIVALCKSD